MEWGRLQDDVATSAAQVADLLRAAPGGDAAVPDLAWTVGELGAHLVTLPRRYVRMLAGGVPFPKSLSALNEAELREVGTTDPAELADLLDAGIADLLNALGGDGDRPVPFFGMEHTVSGVGGVMLGELLVHGLDLTRMLGRPWVIEPSQAVAITRGVLPSVPHLVAPDAVGRAAGVYHVRLRGGDDWTLRATDGDLTVERFRPARADLHISAEPVTNLLVGYRRIPVWRAVLTGRIVAWGLKPWLAARFDSLFVET